MNKETQRFPVGTVFQPIGRDAVNHTVTDFHVTRNLAGKVVKTCYVATHVFYGQTLARGEIAETTIARGLVSTPGEAVPIADPEVALRNMLRRLAEKTRRANGIQHSGGVIAPEDWSELYQLTNEAFGLLDSPPK